MSFDLGFFARHKDTERLAVKEAYNELMNKGEVNWEGNDEFRKFKAALFGAYPAITAESTDEEFEESAWSCTNLVGEGYVHVSIRSGSAGDGAGELIDDLLRKFDVVLCNPQASEADAIQIKYRPSFLERILSRLF